MSNTKSKAPLVILTMVSIAVGFQLTACNNADGVELHFLLSKSKKSKSFFLELADTEALRRRGLMFRKELGEDRGMIFVFEEEQPRTFWMKDTYIPLDMIFLDDELRVVGILRDVPPFTKKPRGVDKPSKYVIELNAGSCAKHGIEVGARAVSSLGL